MKWLSLAFAVYLMMAVGRRVAEARGARRCGCPDHCWCKRPVLSIFRWVFPFRHAGREPHEKEALAQ